MTEHESHKSHESSIVEHNIEESFEQCSRLEKACALNRVPDSELNMLAAALAGTGFEFASMCVLWTFLNNQRGIYNCSLKFPSHLARSGQRTRYVVQGCTLFTLLNLDGCVVICTPFQCNLSSSRRILRGSKCLTTDVCTAMCYCTGLQVLTHSASRQSLRSIPSVYL